MSRIVSMLPWIVVAGACATRLEPLPPTPPPTPTRPNEPELAAVEAATEPSVDFDALRAGLETGAKSAQRTLRGFLASADPARAESAARVLVEHYTLHESFPHVLAVLDAAPSTPSMQRLRARSLADFGRWEEAKDVLRAVLAIEPGDVDARCAFVDVLFATDDLAGAEAEIDELARNHTAHPAVVERASHHDELRRAIRDTRAGEPRPRSVRELIGVVRATDSAAQRVSVWQAILALPDYRNRALRVALLHADARLRVRALRELRRDDVRASDIVLVCLGDPDKRVRAAAAAAASRLGTDPSALVDRLDRETDPYVFRCLHDALGERLGPHVAMGVGDEHDPNTRKRIHDAWRQRCP